MKFKGIQFSTPAFNSRKDSLNSLYIMVDEMSELKKLHHDLTNVHLENIAGISSS